MRKLGMLGIALIGLMALVNSSAYIFFPLSSVFTDSGPLPRAAAILLSLIPLIVLLAVGLFLVLRRERLAASLFPDSEVALGVPTEDLLRVGIVLIGLYFFVSAIPMLISVVVAPVVQFAQMRAEFGSEGPSYGLIDELPRIVSYLAELGLGWFLIVRSRRLTLRLLHLQAPDDVAETEPLAHCPSCGAPYAPADYAGGLVEPKCPECKGPLPSV
jgi:hypothetical protein